MAVASAKVVMFVMALTSGGVLEVSSAKSVHVTSKLTVSPWSRSGDDEPVVETAKEDEWWKLVEEMAACFEKEEEALNAEIERQKEEFRVAQERGDGFEQQAAKLKEELERLLDHRDVNCDELSEKLKAKDDEHRKLTELLQEEQAKCRAAEDMQLEVIDYLKKLETKLQQQETKHSEELADVRLQELQLRNQDLDRYKEEIYKKDQDLDRLVARLEQQLREQQMDQQEVQPDQGLVGKVKQLEADQDKLKAEIDFYKAQVHDYEQQREPQPVSDELPLLGQSSEYTEPIGFDWEGRQGASGFNTRRNSVVSLRRTTSGNQNNVETMDRGVQNNVETLDTGVQTDADPQEAQPEPEQPTTVQPNTVETMDRGVQNNVETMDTGRGAREVVPSLPVPAKLFPAPAALHRPQPCDFRPRTRG